MGVGGVVIPRSLAVEPEIHHLQSVPAWYPGSAPLRWLTIHHMADPLVTGREKLFSTEPLNAGLVQSQLSLLTELACQFCRSIRTGSWIGEHSRTDVQQLIQQW